MVLVVSGEDVGAVVSEDYVDEVSGDYDNDGGGGCCGCDDDDGDVSCNVDGDDDDVYAQL